MIAVIDASILVYLIDPDAKPPLDPRTKEPLEGCQERLSHLIARLERDRATLIVPTPALAEVLVRAIEAAPGIIRQLKAASVFRIAAFDDRAAIECAMLHAERLNRQKRLSRQERDKAKFDEQIVAIAMVEQASAIYSDDSDIRRICENRRGPGDGQRLEVVGMFDLPLPPEDPQLSLFRSRRTIPRQPDDPEPH